MSLLKRWNGSSWQDFVPKTWNGSSWVAANVKRWNGSSWQIISQKTYTETWDSTWTASYGGNGRYGVTGEAGRGYNLYQGRYGDPWSSAYDWGIQRSMVWFNWGDIQNKLSGAKIEKVEVYLYAEHFWYYAGGKAVLGYHNNWQDTKSFAQVKYGVATETFTTRGQGRWINMPIELGEGLRDNWIKGVTLFADSTGLSYYGYFSGYDSPNRPKIRITYKK